jgi:hypothetical protein
MRRLGRSNLGVSRIAFGTSRLGGDRIRERARQELGIAGKGGLRKALHQTDEDELVLVKGDNHRRPDPSSTHGSNRPGRWERFTDGGETVMSENRATAEQTADLWYSARLRGLIRHDAIGPLESTSREVRLASERFVLESLRRRRLASLLQRTDQMLAGLEQLNLLDVERVPEAWPSQLAALIAEMPFEFQPPVGQHPSPTAAIDALFDLQARLLQSITGTEAEADDPLEAAS